MAAHLIEGEFQSDKYPTTPRGKVPLSVKDPTVQDLLWEYAQRRRTVDAEFSADLEEALRLAGYQPPLIVTPLTSPALWRAFRTIDEDNGTHLIGTVYPGGEPSNPYRFEIPAAWAPLADAAEAALKRLRHASKADFNTFVSGEQSDAEEIEKRRGDLAPARKLLDDYFNDWPLEDAPMVEVQP